MSTFIPSAEQRIIFNFIEHPAAVESDGRNGVVMARAGCGKTTTVVQGIVLAPEKRIRLFAFSKAIATELQKRIDTLMEERGISADDKDIKAMTLHSAGFRTVVRYWEGVRVAEGFTRSNSLTDAVTTPRVPDAVKRLITKLHTKAREIHPLAQGPDELLRIAFDHECIPSQYWETAGFTVNVVAEFAYNAMLLAAAKKPSTGIDFADMIYLPVRNNWVLPEADFGLVDEAQDMTNAQLIIARGMIEKDGRMLIVGDDRQAIFGFRGADSGSLQRLKVELNATEMGLKTTYRCGSTIVDIAKELVPDFTVGPNNPAGVVTHNVAAQTLMEQAGPGDFVLSRTNAPLARLALAWIAKGRRVKVAGKKDFGAGLVTILKGLAKGRAENSVPELNAKVATWRDKEVERTKRAKLDDKIDIVHDKANVLFAVLESTTSVADALMKLENLFTDDGLGDSGRIMCSSIHKAKGLESKTVWVLADTLKRTTTEEQNLCYVAYTRAISTLNLVSGIK